MDIYLFFYIFIPVSHQFIYFCHSVHSQLLFSSHQSLSNAQLDSTLTVLSPKFSFLTVSFFGMMWYDTIWYDIFNCNWVDTRWQQYSTHLQTNSAQNNTVETNNTRNNTINNLIGNSAGRAPVFTSYTLAFGLQLREKHGYSSVRVVREC